jgi:hypothetical protein
LGGSAGFELAHHEFAVTPLVTVFAVAPVSDRGGAPRRLHYPPTREGGL